MTYAMQAAGVWGLIILAHVVAEWLGSLPG